MLEISGTVRDSTDKHLPVEITLEAFEESVLGHRFDRRLGRPTSPDSNGKFVITVAVSVGVNARKIYLVMADPRRILGSVRAGQNEFAPTTDSRGDKTWKSLVFENVEDVEITISLQNRPVPNEAYETVVIGSGFGGSIVALTLANKYAAEGSPTKGNRVCVLERGQWWLSGEIPIAATGTTDGKPTMRGYLEEHNVPYGLWATPDDFEGLLRVVGSSRAINPVKGVYDYRTMKNVSTISASGVGGGSLIYFNLTTRPDPATYEHWAIQHGNDRPLDRKYSFGEIYGEEAAKDYFDDLPSSNDKALDYFDIAENFLGVNKITTTAALGRFKLGKSKVFQRAAADIDVSAGDLMNPGDLDADLSITDVPYGTFLGRDPTKAQVARLSWQTNVCERQGRCGLGCIPDARHTMSQRLYDAIADGKPIDVFPLCQVLSVQKNAAGSKYRYEVLLTDFRDGQEGVQRSIQANTVVLAAGTLGSTEILLRSRDLPRSGEVGKRFSTNGDTFGVVSPTKDVVDPGRGPLLTSIARYKDKRTGLHEFSLEDLGIPKMFGEVIPPFLGVMALQKRVDSLVPDTKLDDLFKRHVVDKMPKEPGERDQLLPGAEGFGAHSSHVITKAIDEVKSGMSELAVGVESLAASPEERLQNVLVLFGMGRDESTGRLVIDDEGALTLDEAYDLEQGVYADIVERMKFFAKEIGRDGESDLTMPFWDERSKLGLTAHPLGGCPMGRDASEGVVDGLGRVYTGESGTACYQGLYVADGSIIPTSLGVNPSLTICALAFRIAEEIAGDKKFWPRH